MTSTPKATTLSHASVSPQWRAFFNSRRNLLPSKPESLNYKLPNSANNPFPWLEKLRSTKALDYVLFFYYTSNPNDFPKSEDDSINKYMDIDKRVQEAEVRLARATCQPILLRMNPIDIEDPFFSFEKYSRTRAMAEVRAIEEELLELAISRSALELNMLSGQMAATKDRHRNAVNDVNRVDNYPTREPSVKVPYDGPVAPQTQAALFFTNTFYKWERSDSKAPSYTDSHASDTSSHSSTPTTIFTANDRSTSISSVLHTLLPPSSSK